MSSDEGIVSQLRVSAGPVITAALALGRFLRDCPDLLTDEALDERGRLNRALLDATIAYDELRKALRREQQ